MRKLLISLLGGMALFCLQPGLRAQNFKEQISKEFALKGEAANAVLLIYNINGFIRVEGYNGDKVILEIDKTISADDNAALEKGKQEFKLGFDQHEDSITAYIAEPFDSRPHYHWYNNDTRKIEYDFNVDFTVKVPNSMNLRVSTVNEGEITISNVWGSLSVNNVNAGITITDAKGTTLANTVNGPISINYLSNPPEQSSYYTINGDIRVTYKTDLSADLQFNSMHGEFYTDFTNTEVLPATVTRTEKKNDGKMVYKINKINRVRFGKGGKLFKFETLNGDVYIKKQS